MATQQVIITLSVKDANALRAWLAQQQQVDKLGSKFDKTKNKAKDFNLTLAGGVTAARQVSSAVLGINASLGIVGMTAAGVMRSLDAIAEKRKAVVEPYQRQEESRFELEKILVNQMDKPQRDDYFRRIQQAAISARAKDLTVFYNQIEAVIGAGASPDQALGLVSALSKVTTLKENESYAGFVQDYLKNLPTAPDRGEAGLLLQNPERALGLLIKAAPLLRNEKFSDIGPYVRGMASLQTKGMTPEESAAVMGPISQMEIDKQGRRTANAMEHMLGQIDRAMAAVMDKYATEQQLAEFRKLDPIERMQTLADTNEKSPRYLQYMRAYLLGLANADTKRMRNMAMEMGQEAPGWTGEEHAQPVYRSMMKVRDAEGKIQDNRFWAGYEEGMQVMEGGKPAEQVYKETAQSRSGPLNVMLGSQAIGQAAQGGPDAARSAVQGSILELREKVDGLLENELPPIVDLLRTGANKFNRGRTAWATKGMDYRLQAAEQYLGLQQELSKGGMLYDRYVPEEREELYGYIAKERRRLIDEYFMEDPRRLFDVKSRRGWAAGTLGDEHRPPAFSPVPDNAPMDTQFERYYSERLEKIRSGEIQPGENYDYKPSVMSRVRDFFGMREPMAVPPPVELKHTITIEDPAGRPMTRAQSLPRTPGE